MDCKTYKLRSGVRLTYLGTDRFKKARLSVFATYNYDRKRADLDKILLYSSLLGTEKYPDYRSVCRRCEELYSSDISSVNQLRDSYYTAGFTSVLMNEDYITKEDRSNGFSVIDGVFEIVADLVFRPLLREKDVETEKLDLINRKKSRQNDAFGYARHRFNRIMFYPENESMTLEEEIEQIQGITVEMLKEEHDRLLKNSEFEFFYCGTESAERIIDLINKYFSSVAETPEPLVRKEIIRRADITKNVEETGEYRQGNMLIGFRTDADITDKEFYAVELLNQIYGDSSTSKLFMNVRERLSLCYFCFSDYDEERGAITVGCGIDNGNKDAAESEIIRQLDEIRAGNITDAEMSAAKESLESDCRAAEDYPCDYEDFYITERLFGGPATIEEYRQGILAVTKEEVVAAANRMTVDTVYFLRGTLNGDDTDE